MTKMEPVSFLCTSDVTQNYGIQGPYRSTAVCISSVVKVYKNVFVSGFFNINYTTSLHIIRDGYF